MVSEAVVLGQLLHQEIQLRTNLLGIIRTKRLRGGGGGGTFPFGGKYGPRFHSPLPP